MAAMEKNEEDADERDSANEERPAGSESYKKRKLVFPFGNYCRYYGYRLGRTLQEDPRLSLLQKKWFENKSVLDVGCNEGHVTISLAKKYRVRSMLGVDIDPDLIETACYQVQDESGISPRIMVSTKDVWSKYVLEDGEPDEDEEGVARPVVAVDEETSNSDSHCGLSGKELLERVQFINANFIECRWHSQRFDTVLCLSVAKWIHLNWGDKGLIRLFAEIYRVLRPGGVLVLEPQPWTSYKKKYRVSEVARKNFKKILIRPEHFSAVLLDKIGFKSCGQITSEVANSSAGFSRPLFLYTK